MSEQPHTCEQLRPWPARPHVPVALLCLAVVAVSENLVLRQLVGAPTLAACLALAAAALALCAFLSRRLRARMAVPLLLVAAALIACGSAAAVALQTRRVAQELASTPVSSCEFVLVSDGTKTSSGWLAQARVCLADGAWGRVWLVSGERLAFGSRVSGIGRFSALGDDSWGRTSAARGISGRVRLVRVQSVQGPQGLLGALSGLREGSLATIDPGASEARALLAGVVTAERSELKETGVEDSFSAVGLTHLIAVSGGHLVVVAAGLEALLLAAGVPLRARSLATLGLTGAYVLFCACPSSAVRSWLMLAASLAGRGLGRRAHAPSGMAIAGLAMCLGNPSCACDLGFQLSALSVCALALFGGWTDALLARLFGGLACRRLAFRLPRRARLGAQRLADALRSSLAASLVCQLATLPACALAFGRASLVAPLANAVVAPLFAPVVSLGIAGCSLSDVPYLGSGLLIVAEGVCALCIWLAEVLAGLPFACVALCLPAAAELAPFALAALMLLAWPRPSARTARVACAGGLALAGLSCLLSWALAPPSVVVLDVGQGDAILVRQGPHAVLVDTGPGEAVAQALARQGVFALDAVVLTHLHDDHTGGLDELAGLVKVGEVVVGQGVSAALPPELAASIQELTGKAASELCRGDVISLGDFRLRCLWPQDGRDGQDNEDSLCLLVSFAAGGDSLRLLLTGDAESEVLGELLGDVGDLDVLKLGHHGSAASLTTAQARVLSFELAVASAGENNSYGHPSEACVEAVEEAGALFLSTIEAGDVRIAPGADGPVVSCSGELAL